MPSVIYVVSCPCQNDETGESKCIDLVIRFRNEEQFDTLNDCGFDLLIGTLTAAVNKKRRTTAWYVDGAPEPKCVSGPGDVVDLDVSSMSYAEMK